MIVNAIVVPLEDDPYDTPEIDSAMLLRLTVWGAVNTLDLKVDVYSVNPNWGVDRVKFEGYTNFKGERCKVIAIVVVDRLGDNLGLARITIP